jgi:hypothetical protein
MDLNSYMPKLENIMPNHMKCSIMIFGKMQKNCITYRENESMFTLYQVKYQNDFRVCVDTRNYEGGKGIIMQNKSQLLVQTKDSVMILCCDTFKQLG